MSDEKDQVPPEVGNLIQELEGDLQERFENLNAIKGKKFADFVQFMLALSSYSQFAVSAPRVIAQQLSPPMVAGILKRVGDMMELNEADIKEAAVFCDGMTQSIEGQMDRLKTIVKKMI